MLRAACRSRLATSWSIRWATPISTAPRPACAASRTSPSNALPTDGRLPTATFYYGEGPDKYHIVCGYFGCDARPFNPLLEALPRMFRARLSAATQSWLLAMLQVATQESIFGEAGSQAMLAKFAEVMFAEAVRNDVTQLPENARGWLSALRDGQVGKALQLIHARPAQDWTVDSLAREVGLSRSVFADRFAHHVGVSPMIISAAGACNSPRDDCGIPR